MKMLWAVLAITLAFTAQVQAGICRPTGIDITDRLADGSYLRYFPVSGVPHTASQSERDCMEWASSDRLEELISVAGDLAPNATGKAIDCLNLQFTRISVVDPYEGSLQKPSGATWVVPEFGRHYQCEQKAIAAFRYELTSSSRRAAAAIRFGSLTDLKNLLDVNDSFTGHAAFVLPAYPPLDTTRAKAFVVDTRTILPACGNGDCSLLAATHQAHKCVTDAKCGIGNVANCPSVSAAHAAYESSCGGNELCEAFRRMKPFRGLEDHWNWTTTEICQLARLQDAEHMEWMQAQEIGDWKGSRKHDTNHRIFHGAMNNGDPRRLFVIMCDVSYQDFGTCYGGKQNMQSLLPRLVAAYGN